MNAPKLILASASPRRQQLLREAGYEFTVVPAEIDEDAARRDLDLGGLTPGDLAEYLARRKAEVVVSQFPDGVVLAADTVVAYDQVVLGKPSDAGDAARMLNLLSGTVHSVITGLTIVRASTNLSRHTRVLSAVHMRALTAEEIARYVASNEWQGKAGGYGIQDPDPFVTRTSGCHTNIVGLPMNTTAALLREAGIAPAAGRANDESPQPRNDE